jgi:hypothetical protein
VRERQVGLDSDWRGLLIQTVLQRRDDEPVTRRFQIDGATAGGFEPLYTSTPYAPLISSGHQENLAGTARRCSTPYGPDRHFTSGDQSTCTTPFTALTRGLRFIGRI